MLERPETYERIPYARSARRLPVVLSVDETIRFLQSVDLPRHRVLLTTIYATGLRLSEALALRAADIASKRMVVRVRQSKGKKDHYVPLPATLLEMLREHWRRDHRRDLLLPRPSDPSRPASPTTVQKCMQRFAAKAGLARKITPKTLRHCYATHMIEQGTSTCVVQALPPFGACNVTGGFRIEPLMLGGRNNRSVIHCVSCE